MKRAATILLVAASVQLAIAGWQPGLREVAFNSGNAINKTSYAGTKTNIVLRLERALSGGARTTKTTYVYWGQIYLDGRTWNFAESFNYAAMLKIDGVTILDNAASTTVSLGSLTRAPGWYDFELRLYCYNSATGPVSNDGWGTTAYGFGRNASGYTGKGGSYYSCPADPGDGTLFRCDDGNGTADVLDIASDAAVNALGAAGIRQGLAAGDPLTLTVPSVWRNETATMEATCTGWTLHDASGTEVGSGAGNTASYDHPSPAAYRKLVWHWTISDPTGDANRRYVTLVGGSDSNNGLSWTTAFASIQAAIAACPAGGSVIVGPGTYLAKNTTVTADNVVHSLYINKDIAVLAAEGPEKTIVDSGTDRARAAAKVCSSGALLAGFTFKNSCNSAKNTPAGVEATAGTVSNCVGSVRDQFARQGAVFGLSGTALGRDLRVAPATWSSRNSSSVVYVYGSATLDGLVITNFTYNPAISSDSEGHGADIGYILRMEGNGVVSNALIAGCRLGSVELLTLKPLVYLSGNGVRLSDATIAGNTIPAPYGAIQVNNVKSIATNLVVWGNSSLSATHPDIHNGQNIARVFHSCYLEAPANDASGSVAVDPLFVDAAHGDYRLRPLSKAADMGAPWLRPAAAAPAPFECAADSDAYFSSPGESLAATFTAYATEGHEIVSAVWDFGDGTTGTDWPTAQHTYATPGSYTVTVTITDANGVTATFTIGRSLVVPPATCYVRVGQAGVYPYDSWEKATDDIYAAVAVGPSAVIVTNGTYEITKPHIQLLNPISITSVEGPGATVLHSAGGTSRNHRHFTVGASSGAFISGFTMEDGYSASYYWTGAIEMRSGTLSNCVVRGVRNINRTSVSTFLGTAKVVDCVFDGTGGATLSNSDWNKMSAVRLEGSAVLDRCEIKGYRVDTNKDDGSRDGEAPVCIYSANAVLRNSLVHHCTNGVSQATKHHGVIALINGRIENCTIVDNYSGGYGGGIFAKAGAVVNSIVHGNTALIAGDDLYATVSTPTATYTCASDFSHWQSGAGAGCTTRAPNFDAENPYRLTALSTACIDAGDSTLAWLDGALDLDRQPRVSGEAIDMGCYEFAGAGDVPLDGTLDLSATLGRAPFAVTAEVSVIGDETGLVMTWDFGDGTVITGSKMETHSYAVPGVYQITVTIRNGASEEVVVTAPHPVVSVPETCYVANGAASVPPYATWENAATNIEDAVALAPRNVLVSNGTYQVSAQGVVLSADIELRSVNGPDETVIDSAGRGRCLWIAHAGAVCDGFRLIRGVGNWGEKGNFACVEGGLLSNCILTNCVDAYRDAAVFVRDHGRMLDCVVDLQGMKGNAGHSVYWDVNVSGGGLVDRCVIRNYKYAGDANGGGDFAHSAVTVSDGIVRNCLVQDCEVTASASSGVIGAVVRVTGSGTFENCTVVNSKGRQAGSGLRISATANATPVIRNNIVWGSTATDGSANADVYDGAVPAAPRITYSCASNLTTGEGNLTCDPCFVGNRRGKAPFSLSSSSTLLNAGLLLDWMNGATDLDGAPRVAGPRPAMGCYESVYSGGTVLMLR